MSGTLSLAAAIAELDRGALEELLELRRPASAAVIADPLGLAIELLRPDSIARALSGLDRSALAALLELDAAGQAANASAPTDQPPAELARLALVGRHDGAIVALPEVTAELRGLLARAGVAEAALAGTSPAPERDGGRARAGHDAPALDAPTSNTAAETGWFAPALTSVRRGAALLRALAEQPARLSRRGSVAVTALRGLAERSRAEAATAERLLTTLRLAGLAGPDHAVGPAALVSTPAAQPWLALPPAERWLALASARVAAMDGPLRAVLLRGDEVDLRRAVEVGLRTEYPLLPQRAFDAAAEFLLAAEELGLSQHGLLTPPAVLLLRGSGSAAGLAIQEAMPQTAPGVYLQPDLSLVAPGPLDSQLEEDLLAIAETEQFGVAMSLRITTPSLLRALERGWTADRVRTLLEEVSLTGIPQPLDYLLADIARTHGSIRVSAHHGDEGRSLVTTDRPELLQALRIDRSLQHLQFAEGPEPHTLVSRLSPEHVAASLSDARHPAMLVPASGEDAHATTNTSGAGLGADPETGPMPTMPIALDGIELAAAADRIFEAARGNGGAGDLSRRLELAIREKTAVRVTAVAGSDARSFLLLPISLNAGRLRAADQSAGVERTIPLSAITEVTEP